MKDILSCMQYEQLAKEHFYKIMNDIPIISDVEITSIKQKSKVGDFYAIIHWKNQEKPIRFCVEVKSNGEKRFVNSFMSEIERKNDDLCYVFMAPYISEESANAMKKENVSYMDLSGNCFILTERIYMYLSGQPNKYIAKKEKKNYLSKSSSAASAIMRTMLNKPQDYWQVTILAKESGKAIGTVSNVKSFLRDRDWIKEKSIEFKLQNIKEFLYAWARDYHKKSAVSYEFYSFEAISELENNISEWSASHENGVVLGCFSAAVRYAPTVRYKKVNVYVDPQLLDRFVKDLDLQAVSSGGNVVITIPHDETPCMYAKNINGAYVTSPVQTILDLLGNVGRGEEAANAIIEKEFKEETND